MRPAPTFIQRIRAALGGASRQVARAMLRAAGLDGAAGGRRWRGAGELASPIAAQLAGRETIARRARYLANNNGHGRAAVLAWQSALVGSGIKAQSNAPDPTIRKLIALASERFVDACDLDGVQDFYGLQAAVAAELVVAGEAFVVLAHDPEDGRLRLRMMAAEQVDGGHNVELGGGARIIAGIEFDGQGRRVAIHAFRQRPGHSLAPSLERVRIAIEDVCHVLRVETPGQVRGLSWFAAVLLRLADLDKAHDAQLIRQQIAAMLAGFVTGDADLFDGEKPAPGLLEGGLEPGTLKVLPPGASITFSEPATIGAESIDFLKITAREIAAGLGLPYEALTGDLSGVNYSSIRAGLVDFRRRAEAIQHTVLIRQLCRPVWRRWLTTEILAGRIEAPGFEADPESWLAATWLPPRNDWVDPAKDIAAEIAAIGAGLMSRRQAVAARGYDLEQLDAEIAQDRKDAAALGLAFPPPAPAAPAAKESQP